MDVKNTRSVLFVNLSYECTSLSVVHVGGVDTTCPKIDRNTVIKNPYNIKQKLKKFIVAFY